MNNDPSNSVVTDLSKTYLQTINNSVGSNLFRNLFAKVGGVEKDILNDGELSCAYFVSHILLMFKLINEGHATVKGTVRDMEQSGWVKIEDLREGAVLVWDASVQDEEGNMHDHIGFYIGDDQAISNSSSKRTPQRHFWTFAKEGEDGYRKVSAIYWNEKLVH
jgi:hypothetical protein